MMIKNFFITLFLFLSLHSLAEESSVAKNAPAEVEKSRDYGATAQTIISVDKFEKLTGYRPIYYLFGKDDNKLQFSLKYRLAQKWNLYFAFTQVMFWDIYKKSKPFYDINYHPEVFYRLIENDEKFMTSVDMGFMHSSNGKKDLSSRSLNRIFARGNAFTSIKRHLIGASLMAYYLYDEDDTNKDIKKYMGYWDLTVYMTEVIVHKKQSLNAEIKLFAGERVYNLNRGAYQIGLIYDFRSPNFNPSVYFQFYDGYAENLFDYNKKVAEYRLGVMLTF
jgi:phospholipase A1